MTTHRVSMRALAEPRPEDLPISHHQLENRVIISGVTYLKTESGHLLENDPRRHDLLRRVYDHLIKNPLKPGKVYEKSI